MTTKKPFMKPKSVFKKDKIQKAPKKVSKTKRKKSMSASPTFGVKIHEGAPDLIIKLLQGYGFLCSICSKTETQ